MENLRDLSKLREIVIAEAVELFEGDKAAAEQWLSTPVRGLGHKTPNELLTSEKDIEQVRTLIGRLEHGIIT
ncbi:antitoxin Xre/MbcA/ParS toxin-binding domain-containing protein [Marinobacter nauticus]|uniref:antitoxin Xre/MbcA/ParS toxin-binding domain-containing protein n=1 Tax=Marinobacter nauticus TaxID=2743 RepID=UPI0037369E67